MQANIMLLLEPPEFTEKASLFVDPRLTMGGLTHYKIWLLTVIDMDEKHITIVYGEYGRLSVYRCLF